MEPMAPEMKFEHRQLCVFYDRSTGKVVHVHEYLGMSREQAVSEDELEEQARQAGGDRLRSERMRVLHPPAGMRLQPGARYAVDLRDGTLFDASETALAPHERRRPDHGR